MQETVLKEGRYAGPPRAESLEVESASVAVESGEGLAVPVPPAQVGLWAVLATITMLFAGFTSAYLVRRAGPDWVPIYCPPILWVNTVFLMLSSAALEFAKTKQQQRQAGSLRSWLLASVALGLAFLLGQFFAWERLSALGIFLPTSPHSSFFYMLSGVHAAHVVGGIGGLLYALYRWWRPSRRPGAANAVALCATYWHFITGVWIYLFVLLFVWQ